LAGLSDKTILKTTVHIETTKFLKATNLKICEVLSRLQGPKLHLGYLMTKSVTVPSYGAGPTLPNFWDPNIHYRGIQQSNFAKWPHEP